MEFAITYYGRHQIYECISGPETFGQGRWSKSSCWRWVLLYARTRFQNSPIYLPALHPIKPSSPKKGAFVLDSYSSRAVQFGFQSFTALWGGDWFSPPQLFKVRRYSTGCARILQVPHIFSPPFCRVPTNSTKSSYLKKMNKVPPNSTGSTYIILPILQGPPKLCMGPPQYFLKNQSGKVEKHASLIRWN